MEIWGGGEGKEVNSILYLEIKHRNLGNKENELSWIQDTETRIRKWTFSWTRNLELMETHYYT